jgi:AraC family transcriptional regulator
MQTSGHGRLLNKRFGVQDPPTLVATLSSDQPITISLLCINAAGPLGSIPAESAYSIHTHLNDTTFDIRERGRWVRKGSSRGRLCFYDLQSPSSITLDGPAHSIRAHVPFAALQAFAEEAGWRRSVFLKPPTLGAVDPIIGHLFMSLLSTLQNTEDGNSLFVCHVALALQAHLVQTYSAPHIECRPVRHGLAPWQERRAKEIIDAKLSKGICIAELAHECGLSSGHFARAFKQATGRPPYRWFLERRIEKAQDLLLNSQVSIEQIAATCGFPDKASFTRAFTREVGTSPAAWRRLKRG